VEELDWRGLAAAFKSTPADVILYGAPEETLAAIKVNDNSNALNEVILL
jgi:uncharacterized protein (UPF0218 family)